MVYDVNLLLQGPACGVQKPVVLVHFALECLALSLLVSGFVLERKELSLPEDILA